MCRAAVMPETPLPMITTCFINPLRSKLKIKEKPPYGARSIHGRCTGVTSVPPIKRRIDCCQSRGRCCPLPDDDRVSDNIHPPSAPRQNKERHRAYSTS